MEKTEKNSLAIPVITATSFLGLVGCGEKVSYDPYSGGRAYRQYSASQPGTDSLGERIHYGAHDVGNWAEGCGQGAAVVLTVSLAVALALRKILK